ncbi:glycoside hydrolase family 3 N-terminal domain-containing protein [Nonomuraea solani]
MEPFRAAVEAGTTAIMPYYGMPVGLVYRGREIEEVGFGYNKQIITGILRDELGYDGVVVTDWQFVSDVLIGGRHLPARAWGVEHLDRPARIRKILDAGCDQLGGETCTDVLLDLVRGGQVREGRLDESLTRLLSVKFELGLFDNPYVDVDHAAASVGTPEAVRAGMWAQTASVVLLRRPEAHPWPRTVYVRGMAQEAFDGLATVVDDPAGADAAVVRLAAPFEPRDDFVLEPFFHAGSLEFSADVVSELADLAAQAPLVVDVTLDRPAVLTPVADLATVLLGSFSSSDRAIALVVTGHAAPRGELPFDLPASMAAVERSRSDVPGDLDDVLFARAPQPPG